MKVFPLPQEVASYDPGLRTIHWLMAALIFVALPLGVWASLLPGGSGLSLTGQLGDVMKESAQAARSYLWSHAAEFGIEVGAGHR